MTAPQDSRFERARAEIAGRRATLLAQDGDQTYLLRVLAAAEATLARHGGDGRKHPCHDEHGEPEVFGEYLYDTYCPDALDVMDIYAPTGETRAVLRSTSSGQVFGVRVTRPADYPDEITEWFDRFFSDKEVADTYATQWDGIADFAGEVVPVEVSVTAPTVLIISSVMFDPTSYRRGVRCWDGELTPESLRVDVAYIDDDRVPQDSTTQPVEVKRYPYRDDFVVMGTDEAQVRQIYVTEVRSYLTAKGLA